MFLRVFSIILIYGQLGRYFQKIILNKFIDNQIIELTDLNHKKNAKKISDMWILIDVISKL